MTAHTSIDTLILLVAYFLGSLPFGLLMSQLFKQKDPRTMGSGTTGATNVLRGGSKSAAILTLILDTLKGAMAVMFAAVVDPSMAGIAGIVAVIGHIWPVWLGFHGGKGVATAFGVITILSWPVAVGCLLTWITVACLTRYSSLSSLIAVSLAPVYALFIDGHHLIALCMVIAALLLWTHRGNIQRLRTGRESHIGDHIPPSPK